MTQPKDPPNGDINVSPPDRQTPKRTFGHPEHAPPRPPVLTPGPDLPKPPPGEHQPEPTTGESPTKG